MERYDSATPPSHHHAAMTDIPHHQEPAGEVAVTPLTAFDPGAIEVALQAGDHDDAGRRFITVLDHLRQTTFTRLDAATQQALDVFVESFLHTMVRPEVVFADALALRLIDLNAVIGNVVALSGFRTTDPYVRILVGQPGNFAKLLALANARTTVPLDRRAFFDTSPAVATRWYWCYLEAYRTGCASDASLANLREHIRFDDDRLEGVSAFTHHASFGATSIDHKHDAGIKRRINRLVAASPLASRPIRNEPSPKRIGVFTGMWFPAHSVYRSQFPLLEALAKDHDLTLVHLGPQRPDLDTRLFSEVLHYDAGRAPSDISAFEENDFALAYFPDVGMTIESVLLANLRIAPIQVSGYGHPVSTHGAKIDYWIGGRDVEDMARAADHYSERLVLIPGCAQAPVPLEVPPKLPRLPESPVVVSCNWTAQKVNPDHLRRLRAIADRAHSRVRFHFFPGGAVMGNGFLPLERSIVEILGAERVRVFPDLPADRHLEALAWGHVAFDAHPFGGYNSALDLLALRKPILTLTGDRFYNRSTAFLLRQVGLDDLVATTEEAFIDLGVRLIDDAAFRDRMLERLRAADLAATVFSHEHVPAFVRAIEHLLAHHAELARSPDREAILVD